MSGILCLKRKTITVLFLLLLTGFFACNFLGTGKKGERLAKVHGNYLYSDDLDGVVLPGISEADSVVIVKRFIENWVRQQVFLNHAQANTSTNIFDIERKVEDYRNSLIIFTYENEIISQQLDTVISDELLAEYFDKHQDEFKLRDNIIRANFVKLPVDAPYLRQIRNLLRSDDPEDVRELEEYCINHAATYSLDHDSWFIFTDILREIPLDPSNHENFLRNNSFVELTDEYYRYFLYIRDYKLEGSTSPLTFQEENIRAIILNHRKQTFINQYRQDLYMDAVKNKKFEIF